jgi:hypothetical protein
MGAAATGIMVADPLPDRPDVVAVTVAFPVATATAAPWTRARFETVKTDVFEELHVTMALTSWTLPSLKVPRAENFRFAPTAIVGLAGDTVTDTSVGEGATVKLTGLLAAPATVTITLPVVAPVGTVVEIDVSRQSEPATVAAIPLKVIVLAPWFAPKFVPETATNFPTGPESGEIALIEGGKDPALVTVSDTLSNVAVDVVEPPSLATSNPTLTFCSIGIV